MSNFFEKRQIFLKNVRFFLKMSDFSQKRQIFSENVRFFLKMSNFSQKRQIFFKNAQFTQKFDIFIKNLTSLLFYGKSNENFDGGWYILKRMV